MLFELAFSEEPAKNKLRQQNRIEFANELLTTHQYANVLVDCSKQQQRCSDLFVCRQQLCDQHPGKRRRHEHADTGLRRLLKLTHQGATPDWGQSLMPTTA